MEDLGQKQILIVSEENHILVGPHFPGEEQMPNPQEEEAESSKPDLMIKLLPSIPLEGSSTIVKMIHIQYASNQKTGAGPGRNADYHPRSPHPEMILANIW